MLRCIYDRCSKGDEKELKQHSSKGRLNRSAQDPCRDISCLATILQVLKVDKDTVRNFIQQKKRIDSRVNLASMGFKICVLSLNC